MLIMKLISIFSCAMRGRPLDDIGQSDICTQRIEVGEKKTSNAITTVQKDMMLLEIYAEENKI